MTTTSTNTAWLTDPDKRPGALVRAPEPSADDKLITLWLHGKSAHTLRSYRRLSGRFRASLGKPLPECTLADLQAYDNALAADPRLSDGGRANALAVAKSLLSFGQKIGYLPANVGAALELPKTKDTLAERILPETDMLRIIAMETNHRNAALLRFLYGAGCRVSEAAGLCWRDMAAAGDAGIATIYGKGGKTRHTLLSAGTWSALQELREDASEDEPVFRSRKGGALLTTKQIWRICKAAADRAGVKRFSPHFARHAHISHALDRGARIHVVQQTVGHSSLHSTSRYAHCRPDDSSARYLAI